MSYKGLKIGHKLTKRGRKPPLRVFYKCKDMEIMEETKKTWGGARAGAGRKAREGAVKVQLSCKVAPDVFDVMKKMSYEKGMSLGKIVEEFCRYYQEHEKQ